MGDEGSAGAWSGDCTHPDAHSNNMTHAADARMTQASHSDAIVAISASSPSSHTACGIFSAGASRTTF